MADLKTKPTEVSVESYLAAIADDAQRADCEALAVLMKKWTKQTPKVWGGATVGFGDYHYVYESGREGDWYPTGFSARKGAISIYLVPYATDTADMLAALGKHKMGKGCLTIKKLSDVDVGVLEKLVAQTIAEMKRRYP